MSGFSFVDALDVLKKAQKIKRLDWQVEYFRGEVNENQLASKEKILALVHR